MGDGSKEMPPVGRVDRGPRKELLLDEKVRRVAKLLSAMYRPRGAVDEAADGELLAKLY
jgi:hypothetical protein